MGFFPFELAPWKLARWADGTLPSNARIPFGSAVKPPTAQAARPFFFRDEWSFG